MNPRLLLADEPTGNLDKNTGEEVMEVLMDLNRKDGMGIIMVTHDAALIGNMDRKLELTNGRLQ
jgi:predicted ABC-type transport system involved in lysophospholipase L1 biosynthesis ATPase subunit